MAYYTFLDTNNIVTEVITGTDDATIEGIDTAIWYGNYRGLVCKQTFIDDPAKQYAGIGMGWDGTNFIPCPYEGAEWDGAAWVPSAAYQLEAARLMAEALENEKAAQ